MVETSPFSVDAARSAARRDELEAWVAEYLSSPGSDNAALATELLGRLQEWLGPVSLPINRLHRLAGPADHPVLCPVDDDAWRDDVDDMADKIEEDGWEPAPLIVSVRDGQLVLEDGNHRVEGLRRAGEAEAWAVVGFDAPEDRDPFLATYGPVPA
jgi:hypothetical protein